MAESGMLVFYLENLRIKSKRFIFSVVTAYSCKVFDVYLLAV